MSTSNDDSDSESDVIIEDGNELIDGIIEDNKYNSPTFGYVSKDNTDASDLLEINALDTIIGQNRLWNDLCPFDSFPVLKTTLNAVGTGIMNVRKDCYRCKKSFTLDADNFKFVEVPFSGSVF
jgi:hypothetical protein